MTGGPVGVWVPEEGRADSPRARSMSMLVYNEPRSTVNKNACVETGVIFSVWMEWEVSLMQPGCFREMGLRWYSIRWRTVDRFRVLDSWGRGGPVGT